ncbi:uncharacterized protein LOC111467567 isoform X3 [Cucurbita maxima]|uniref:Uncharacterized protein LOC111467567 isoform X3 n=1 Tax=Cucurbita maxima TaxID=3661 RepID=A0A6J1HUG9_CUCMA|nr:uncharacterized protein LOC111467567 isoform X3 [Cucurbita maxima]
MAERPNKAAAAAAGIGVRKLKIFPHASSLASIESLSLPLVQEIVFTADIGCAECQKKLANILSKMNDTESVVVNLLDKKVILTRKLQIPSSRVSTVKRLLGSSFR